VAEVAGIQVSAPVAAQVTQATLPFTGVSTTGLGVIAAALAGAGVLALALSRRIEERESLRSWN
jgi:LPXTG cell wall anchor motif